VLGLARVRKKKGKTSGKGKTRVGLYREASRGRRESRRTARLRSTGGADVPFGLAWRPLGIGGSMWRGEEEPAQAARAVEGLASGRVE
jgi:hypothetical protein